MYQLELIKYKDILFNVKRKFKVSELKSNFDTNFFNSLLAFICLFFKLLQPPQLVRDALSLMPFYSRSDDWLLIIFIQYILY